MERLDFIVVHGSVDMRRFIGELHDDKSLINRGSRDSRSK